MISEIRITANRANAQNSTGPRTPEGKARVSQNAQTHGLRSRYAVLLMENHHEYHALLKDLHSEWQPATVTEQDLVEQMAVNKWKIARYEAAESQACMGSATIHLAVRKIEGKSIDPASRVEAAAERRIAGFSQLIARLERSYFRALQFLLRLQDLRRKRQQLQPGALDTATSPRRRPSATQPSRDAGPASPTPVSMAPSNHPVPVSHR